MKTKLNLIVQKIYDVIRANNIKLRRNLFEVFAAPLFDLIAPVYYYQNLSEKDKLDTLWRKDLKKFLKAKPTFKKEILQLLKPYDYMSRTIEIYEKSQIKIKESNNSDIQKIHRVKQKRFITNKNFLKSKISKNIDHRIIKIVNIVGMKDKEGKRLSNRRLQNFFGMSTFEVIKECTLNTTEGNRIYAKIMVFLEENMDAYAPDMRRLTTEQINSISNRNRIPDRPMPRLTNQIAILRQRLDRDRRSAVNSKKIIQV